MKEKFTVTQEKRMTFEDKTIDHVCVALQIRARFQQKHQKFINHMLGLEGVSFPDYFYKENIAKDKKVIPDPIDDRKFQE